ncbi:cell division FtsA domain-containing protein [Brockia lithotrophica]|uniref:Cell division protein FtsA n=1 Tax=Brockia lithotrophica TaxID=933949 RepID=A0A660LA93_9BACL|nr:cell division FtsA domain-containing protein [Brockia lithotrophica]RKQ88490.1 cell division protein FtsA [Brockia lithotrophica]
MVSRSVIAAVDIGTHRVRVVVGERRGYALYVRGAAAAPIAGTAKSRPREVLDVLPALRRALEEAEAMAHATPEVLVIGVGGAEAEIAPVRVSARRDPRTAVDDAEVEALVAAAQGEGAGAYVPEVLPRRFLLDGVRLADPRGHAGHELVFEGWQVRVPEEVLEAYRGLLNRLEREAVYRFRPFAVLELLTHAEERREGVVVVDVGGWNTELIAVKDAERLVVESFPFGGAYLTRDVARVLGISLADAEQLKLAHGVAYVQEAADVEVLSLPSEKGEAYLRQTELAQILEARLEEILTLVRSRLEEHALDPLPTYVFTGGTSALPGFTGLVRRLFPGSVRIGYPQYMGVRHPSLSGAVALLHAEALAGLAEEGFRRHDGIREEGWIRRVREWLLERF